MSYGVTVFWFLLFINAVNLIDGLDGLAVGISFKDGADDYVNKPFHMEDIRIKVDRLIVAKKAKKALKKMTGVFRALIISIPLWLILGIILGIIWNRFMGTDLKSVPMASRTAPLFLICQVFY